uniref:DPH2_0 protein n=1 Tax=Fopius arisanus TaxID=64838 RepID=A0A0C9Q1Q3_9HYME
MTVCGRPGVMGKSIGEMIIRLWMDHQWTGLYGGLVGFVGFVDLPAVTVDGLDDVLYLGLMNSNFVADEMGMSDVCMMVGNMLNMSMCLQVKWVGVEWWDCWLLGYLDSINMVSVLVAGGGNGDSHEGKESDEEFHDD